MDDVPVMVEHTRTRTIKRKPLNTKSAPKPARRRKPRVPKPVRLALADFEQRLLRLFPEHIQQIILYGSYSRGDWRAESDVDVLVVVKWNEKRLPGGRYLAWYGDPRWNQIIEIASDILLERGVYISPLVMSEVRLAAREETVLHAIQHEGKTLWKTQQI